MHGEDFLYYSKSEGGDLFVDPQGDFVQNPP